MSNQIVFKEATKPAQLKKYHPLKERRRNEMMITFNPRQITFSQKCRKHLRRKDYCELFYSDDKKTIGVKPYQIKTEDTLKISGNNEISKTNPSTACVDFNLKIGITDYLKRKNKKSIQALAFWDDKQKLFLLKLDFK